MYLTLVLGLAVVGVRDVAPWNPQEHRLLADSAFRIVLTELGAEAPSFPGPSGPKLALGTEIWSNLSFGKLAERFARNDGAASRFQQAGKTVYEQLSTLTQDDIKAYWLSASDGSILTGPEDPPKPRAGNVVGNYLLTHLVAIHFASVAGSSPSAPDALRRALVYESMAQGFLADAHASGHLLVPRHDPFQALHPINNRSAHDSYSTEGVFVVNGRHEAWEAFGDGLLTWYARSYRQTLAACTASLREVLLVYYERRGAIPESLTRWVKSMTNLKASDLVDNWLAWKDGGKYYESSTDMPSLNFIPMPVSATWSIRGKEKNDRQIRIRRHYPQFREAGYHDPKLLGEVATELYSKNAFPARFVPPAVTDATLPATIAGSNRDWASVEFVQVHKLPADYAGLLVEIGTGLAIDTDRSAPAIIGRLGYGIADDILVASYLSVNAGIIKSLDTDFVTPATLVAGLNPIGLPLRMEFGYATTTEDFLSDSAPTFGAALDLTRQVLGFTYVGVSVRLRYGLILLDDVIHTASIQLAFY